MRAVAHDQSVTRVDGGRGSRAGLGAAVALGLAMAFGIIAPTYAHTATSVSAAAAPTVAATAATGATPAAPAAVNTGGPAAQQTGAPPPLQTGGTNPVETGAPAPATGIGAAATPPGTPDSGAPWLPWLVGAVIVAALAGLGVFAWRQRSPAALAPAPAVAHARLDPVVEPPAAPVAQVRCPNCDSLNPADRRYCDECGQDLRPAIVTAAAPPVPVVDEATTPYLETLSRVDEQLEFVLARNSVTIGRALDNDIVIDDQFVDWQTVSPHHARLVRQPDGFVVEDLSSDNGTFVNSARTGENLLEDGMTLALGKVEFLYRVPHD